METANHPDDAVSDDLGAYAGRWVAVRQGRVVGQGGTPEQARRAAQAAHPKEALEVRFVPAHAPLGLPERLEQVRQALPGRVQGYLVGGAVRDAMLNKETRDLDFVLSGEVLPCARRVADRLGGAYFTLDEERKTGRVILIDTDGVRKSMDFAALRGGDLESDLWARDFTVNAMAVSLDPAQALFDPTGGAADLRARQLRACTPESLREDPVRILRGVRLAAALEFKIQPETRKLMRLAVPLLPSVSAERLRDELFRILEGPRPAACLRALDILDALGHILPEVTGLKGVQQSQPHVYDAWTHTMDIVQRLTEVLAVLGQKLDEQRAQNWAMGLLSLRLGRFRQNIYQHFSQTHLNLERSLIGIIFLGALFHDSGKRSTRQEDGEGRVRFLGHEQAGVELAIHRARALRLSNAEIDRLEVIVRQHMRPLLLARSEEGISRRAVYRFFRDCGPAGVEICLLALADTLATYGPALPSEVWVKQVDVVRTLLEAWWEQPEERIRPAALLNGDDLQSIFHLPPGPQLGELLEGLREAQASGTVMDREQALEWVRIRLGGAG